MPNPTNVTSPDGATVLIAEDSPTQAEQLRWLLEQNGFVVIAARNGKDALDMARSCRPSIIVSDVMMPEMDGYALCRAVKADPELKTIGVILVTALASPHDVFNGLECGADNFLVKPYQEEQLVSRIRSLLAHIAKAELAKKAGFVERRRDTGIEIEMAGKRHLITSNRQQIVDVLISTYEQTLGLNEQLAARQVELARTNETLNCLYDLASGFNHRRTEAEVVSFAVTGALKLPGVRGAWLLLRDGDGFRLAGEPQGVKLNDAGECGEACACQRLLDSGGLTSAENIQQCERLFHTRPGGICGHVSIPLMIDGKGAGLLNLISDRPDGTFSADRRRMLASLGIQISDALERARMQEVLERKVEERTRQLQGEVVTRRQAERAAGTAKERLLDAIECINDGFALYDDDDALLVCNGGYQKMHASIKDLVAPGAKFEALVRAGLDCGDGPLVRPSEDEVEACLASHRRADGTSSVKQRGKTWLLSSERRTREGGVVVVETDITELKKADIIKDEFLAKVSHELRTPLTPIHGALSLIKSGKIAHLPDKIEELVDLASRNCTRLISIVNDLLDFTRIGAGKFSVDVGVVDIEAFLNQVVENKRIGPKPPDIKLRIDPRVKGAKLNADPTRIQQVLDNLLSNAIKYADTGDPIEVSADRRDESLRVSVVDHGPGIPNEFRPRVFDAFAQADSSSTRRQGGVGLGLSICKSIVEEHGGTIGFTSKEGKGATFFFELPLPRLDKTEAKGKRPSRGSVRQPRDGGSDQAGQRRSVR